MRAELALGSLSQASTEVERVDADAAGRADAELAHLAADLGGLADLGEELLALLGGAHGGAAAGAGPDRGDEGADREAVAGDVVGHALDRVEVAVDVEVRGDDEEVDAVELLAVGLGVGGELEQGVEGDDRLGCRGRPCRRCRATWRCAASGSCWAWSTSQRSVFQGASAPISTET